MNRHILFVHIPKTAGTSFRLAAEDYFGEECTFYDYGPEAGETTKTIREHIYENNDFYSLKQEFDNHSDIFLSGHFPVKRYMSLFDTRNVITFVREPIAQVISHYVHFKDKKGYKKSLIEFIQDEKFKNIQSKLLKNKPLELFGFVGLTEEYEKSLELINYYMNTNIKLLKENKNKKSLKEKNNLNDEVLKLIIENNQEDIKLYEKAKALFREHLDAHKLKKEFIYTFYDQTPLDRTSGIAYARHDSPVEVTVDNENVKALKFRRDLLEQGIPRNGYVGFGNYRDPQVSWFNEKQLDNMSKYKEADFLRDIANLLFERGDLDNANRLISRALKLRPNGTAIKALKNKLSRIFS